MLRRRRLAVEALEPRLVLSMLGLGGVESSGGPPERFIVMLDETVADVAQAAETMIGPWGGRLGHVYEHALKGFSVELPGAAVQHLLNNPQVKLIEPDVLVYAMGDTVPEGVRRIGRPDESLYPIPRDRPEDIVDDDDQVDVDIAIIDTGIKAHPDLIIEGGAHFYSYSTGPPWSRGPFQDDNYADDNGHGTHVAGTAAARDQGWGYIGVAPGARLWAVKVLDAYGAGYVSDITAGVDWVVGLEDADGTPTIEVANMSLGWQGGNTDDNSALRTAIQTGVAKGIVFVVSAGNEAQDIYGPDGTFGGGDDFVPAAYPEVATISAFVDTDGQAGGEGSTTVDGPDDSFASFSNYSASVAPGNPVTSPGAAIDLTMPGVDVWSTHLNDDFVQMSGTSMASPHAAGLAALYIAENARADDAAGVYAIRQALIDGAMYEGSGNWLAYPDSDPDGNGEGIGWAGPVGEVTDLAVVDISAPASAIVGESVSVDVTVTNVGNQDVTIDIDVTLTDEIDASTIGTQTIPGGLIAGESTTLTFSWDTTGASLGDHTLTATQDFADDLAGNDASSAVVSVEAALTDVAVVAVDAPNSASQGSTVDVVVTVENVGNQDVTSDVDVTLTDDSDGVPIGTQTISGGLAAGASTALTFSWDTTGASLGDHTLTATQRFADEDSTNDSGSAIVTVQEVGGAMHVADLDGWATTVSRNFWQANVAICVVDALGDPLAGATVTGTWGNGSTSVSTPTGADGRTTVTSANLHRRVASTTFTVTAVTLETWTYDPSANSDLDGDSDGTTITIFKDAAAAAAMVPGDAGSLEAMYHEIAWHYALQQRAKSQLQRRGGASPQVVDSLLAESV